MTADSQSEEEPWTSSWRKHMNYYSPYKRALRGIEARNPSGKKERIKILLLKAEHDREPHDFIAKEILGMIKAEDE